MLHFSFFLSFFYPEKVASHVLDLNFSEPFLYTPVTKKNSNHSVVIITKGLWTVPL